MEWNYYSKTSVGYSHIKAHKPCQDFSACYHDEYRTIVTACDGYDGKINIRSQIGSKLASDSVMRVFSGLTPNIFRRLTSEEVAEKLKKDIIREWNLMVENNLLEEPIGKDEIKALSKREENILAYDGAKAYDTTLNGAMILGNRLVCAGLGGGNILIIKKDGIYPAFNGKAEGQTSDTGCSMCGKDTYKQLKTGVFDLSETCGILLCTDGLINPYRNMENFNRAFIAPMTKLVEQGRFGDISSFINRLGKKLGVGDDVSLGLIMKRENALYRA